MFEFTQNVTLEVTQGEDLLTKSIMTPNPEAFAQLTVTKDQAPWHVAIQALKQIIDFTVKEYYPMAVISEIHKMAAYSSKEEFMKSRGNILVNNGMSVDAAEVVYTDPYYGFVKSDNIRLWIDA